MELRTHGLELHLHQVGKADSEGWTRVQVEVRVNGFLGRYTAQLQIEDLERFANELQEMEDGLGQDGKAALCSAEPYLSLELDMNRLGQIKGHYLLGSERRDGVPTTLTGAFELDRSFLPSSRQQCAALVSRQSFGKAL